MVASFLAHLQTERRYSPNTVLSYKTDLLQFTQFLDDTFQEKSPQDISYKMIRAWVVHLMECGLDPKSVNRKIACLRSFYTFCMKRGKKKYSPITKINSLKTAKRLPTFVQEKDMVALLDGCKFNDDFEGWRDKLVIELLYDTGIRLSELIHLNEVHIDMVERTIKVLGKGNKERIVPFPRTLISVIEAYKKAKNKEITKVNSTYLLVTHKGKQLYPMMVYRIVKKHLNLVTQAKKRSPHILRHSFATHLLNRGADINAIKDLLGHSSLAATQVYTHNSIEQLKKTFLQAHPKA